MHQEQIDNRNKTLYYIIINKTYKEKIGNRKIQ